MTTALVPLDQMQTMAAATLPRLLEKVEQLPWSGCWVWLGGLWNSGYGHLKLHLGKECSAHRVSYLGHIGSIPKGMCVLHKCDVKTCVNPAHLFLGTKQDNTLDMVKKGRHYSDTRTRTNCPRGHPYDGINTRGARICRRCNVAATLRCLAKKGNA